MFVFTSVNNNYMWLVRCLSHHQDINWAMEDLNRLEDRLTGKGAEASDAKQKEFTTK